MLLYRIIATFFGIGYIGKGAGTVAALFVCVLLYAGIVYGLQSGTLLLFISVAVLIAGIIAAGKVEKSWGKDNKRVVIDEVLGMTVSVLFLPVNIATLLAGFVLFRFFDIRKPLYIRRLEKLNGGWGVMLDDLLAGIYTNVVLQLAVYLTRGYYEGVF